MKSNGMKFAFCRLLLLGVLVFFTGHFAKAQNLASINGRVQDSSGAAVPGAIVTVTSTETGATRTATSDDQGDYHVVSLPVGGYAIKSEKSGFKTYTQTGLQLTVGQTAVINIAMEVGQVQQQVTVTADVPIVNTSTVSTAGLINQEQIKDLPLNGRSFDLLISLDSGTANYTSNKTAGAGANLGNLFVIAGREYYQNTIVWNGVIYFGPNQTHSVAGNVSGSLLGVDAVREFNVQTNAYDAQYGGRAGGQMNAVSMSGTNDLHGNLFEFIRNSALDARNFFDHPLGERIPPFKRNQFGGSFGGPIQKDKTFFFINYEGFRQVLGVSDAPIVPSYNARNGFQDVGTNVSSTIGQCPQGTQYPSILGATYGSVLPYLDAFYPAPNGNCLGLGSASGFYSPPEHIREDFANGRLDHTFSSKDTLSASYLFDDGFSVVPQLDPVFAVDTVIREQLLSVQETHVFSPSVINVATFGYMPTHWHFTTPSLTPIPASLDLVAGRYIGRFAIGGTGGLSSGTISSGGGGRGINSETHTGHTTIADSLSWTKGRNQFMFGVWFMPLHDSENAATSSGAVPSFTGMAQLEGGQFSSFIAAPLASWMSYSQFEGAWFAQDIIQITPKLTLRLGLRHEFTNGWMAPNNQAAIYTYSVWGQPSSVPTLGNQAFTTNNTKWLFGPRVGLAYDPFGNGKTSIRAGFGTHFDLEDTVGFNLNSMYPFNGTVTYTTPSNSWAALNLPIPTVSTDPPPCTGGAGVPAGCAVYVISGIQPNAKAPTVYEYNLSVEHSFGPNMSLSVGYVGSHMVHGMMNAAPDAIMPQICQTAAGCLAGGVNTAASGHQSTVPQGTLYLPVGKLPNPNLSNPTTYIVFENNDLYNSLEVSFKRRLSRGLQFTVNYTWSRNEDFLSGYSADDANDNGSTLDAYNPNLDWGPTSGDKKHKVALNMSYRLPFGQGKQWLNSGGAMDKIVGGWQFNSIFTASSGFPFDNNVGNNFSGDGNAQAPDRPYWNPNFKGNPITGNPNQWFNPDAFTLCASWSPAACWGTPASGSTAATGQASIDQYYQNQNNPNCPQSGTAGATGTVVQCGALVALPSAAWGTYGNVGRNVLRGPGLVDWDMSLFKNTKITEKVTAEFRWEVFNVLNHANFTSPALSDYSTATPSASAGVISSTNTTSRQMQFGLKILF